MNAERPRVQLPDGSSETLGMAPPRATERRGLRDPEGQVSIRILIWYIAWYIIVYLVWHSIFG